MGYGNAGNKAVVRCSRKLHVMSPRRFVRINRCWAPGEPVTWPGQARALGKKKGNAARPCRSGGSPNPAYRHGKGRHSQAGVRPVLVRTVRMGSNPIWRFPERAPRSETLIVRSALLGPNTYSFKGRSRLVSWWPDRRPLTCAVESCVDSVGKQAEGHLRGQEPPEFGKVLMRPDSTRREVDCTSGRRHRNTFDLAFFDFLMNRLSIVRPTRWRPPASTSPLGQSMKTRRPARDNARRA